MRRHAKASSAGPISSTPAAMWGMLGATLAVSLLCLLIGAPKAAAVDTHPKIGAVGPSAGFTGFLYARNLSVNPANGDLYAIDLGDLAPVYRFNAAGTFLNKISGSTTPQGAFAMGDPGATAVDGGAGTVYVADTYNGLVDAFDPSGALVSSFGTNGQLDGSATPATAFSTPCGLAVRQSNGRLYVGDPGNNRVWIFSNTGAYIGAIADSLLNGPCGVAVDSTGRVYVQNANDGKVIRFTSGGEFAGVVYAPSDSGTPSDPSDDLPAASAIAVNGADDHLFVNTGDRFNEYDAEGTLLNTSGLGELGGSAGIAVDPSTGNIYVSTNLVSVYIYGPAAFVSAPEVALDAPVPNGLGAHFSGSVDPKGAKTKYRFELSLDDGSPEWEPFAEASSSSPTPIAVEADRDLVADTDYLVRISAKSIGGEAVSSPKSFSIGTVAPTLKVIPGSGRTTSEVRLNATINSNGLPTTYRFEWGLTSSYGNTIPADGSFAYAGLSGLTIPYSKPVSGLAPSTTIHYRVIARNAAGEAVSADQTVTTLAEPVAYEMVSPVNKAGGKVSLGEGLQVSLDGNSAAYTATAPFPPSESNLLINPYLSRRSGSEWTTKALALQQLVGNRPTNGSTQGYSPDLSHVFLFSQQALAPGAVSGDNNMYVRNIDTGALGFVGSNKDDETFGMGLGGATTIFLGASADGSHMLFKHQRSLTSEAPDLGKTDNDYIGNIYDFTGGAPKLVSILPNGAPATDAITLGPPYAGGSQHYNGISADGSRIFFRASGGALYVREDGKTTTLISRSHRVGDDPAQPYPAEGAWASRDGSAVYFLTSKPLTEDAPPQYGSAIRLYMYDVGSGELAYVDPPSGGGPANTNSVHTLLGVSDDGSIAYFSAYSGVLESDGSFPRTPASRLYMIEDGVVKFIGQGVDDEDISSPYFSSAGVSPSGRYLTITSGSPGLATPEASNCHGCKQVFVYDRESDAFSCASCNPTGGTSGQVELPRLYQENTGKNFNRLIVDSGRVYFNSADQLLPEDTNDQTDVYQWQAGQLDLVSPGKGNQPSYYGDVSPDGRSVYFFTNQQLVTQDIDHALDIYSARVGGGLAGQNQPRPEALCFGEGCLGASPIPPGDVTPGSNGFVGPGSPKPGAKPRQRPKCGKGRHAKKVKGKSKCVKRTPSKNRKGSK